MDIEMIKRPVCSVCGHTGPEALESENAEDLAREHGWSVRNGNTLCPLCAESVNKGDSSGGS